MKDSSVYFAFFDVDETLINFKSMFSFLKFYHQKITYFRIFGLIRYILRVLQIFCYRLIGKDRNFLNRYYYSFYKGISKNFLEKLSLEWFSSLLYQKNIFNLNIISELRKHQAAGAEIVLVSGSFFSCLKPLAEHLKIQSVLSTHLEEIAGKLTGRITVPMIGEDKAHAIKKLAQKNNINLKHCYAYGDHSSDVPMLELVGHPIVVGKNLSMIQHAKNHGWKIII